MKLHFETWLDTQKISTEAQASFDESFICFKVGAYRAALIFSYIGFMNVIADRILNAKRPSPFPSDWGKLQDSVNATKSPDGWETETFKVVIIPKIVNKKDNPERVFNLSDDLRKQVEYWRARRNDCAHSKPNLIPAAYVESFYAFLESNLGKFAVDGSKLQMQKKILECFDPDHTPNKDEKLQDTIRHELPNSLGKPEYLEFIKDTYSELSKLVGNEPHYEFLNSCFRYGTDDLTRACKKFLNQEEKRSDLADFLLKYPENSSIVLGAGEDDIAFVLWNKKIAPLIRQCYPGEHFNLLCSFLNASLIKSEDAKTTVLEGIVDKLDFSSHTCHHPLSLDEVCLNTLFKAGMGNVLKERILKIQIPKATYSQRGKVSNPVWKEVCWLNNAANLITEYLHRCPIEHDVAVKIARFLELQRPAEPQKLKSALDEFFKDNQCKEKEFYKHLDEQPKGS